MILPFMMELLHQIWPSAQLQGFRTKANENTTAGVENGKHGQISWDTQISWRYFLLRSKNHWSASSYLKRILMGWLNFDLTWKRDEKSGGCISLSEGLSLVWLTRGQQRGFGYVVWMDSMRTGMYSAQVLWKGTLNKRLQLHWWKVHVLEDFSVMDASQMLTVPMNHF